MKKNYLLIFLILFANCGKPNYPKIDNKFEVFDNRLFNTYSHREDGKQDKKISFYLPNGSYVKMIKDGNSIFYFETPPFSLFRITKSYFSNGYIKEKGISINTGTFRKGIWYSFNEKGEFSKEINYDTPFTFTFENVFTFCTINNIPLTSGAIVENSPKHYTRIFRSKNEKGIYYWQIEYLKESALMEIIFLNGQTGEVIDKLEVQRW